MTSLERHLKLDLENLEKHIRDGADPHTIRFLKERIQGTAEALKGMDRKQDDGPWIASLDGRSIQSDDFDHDVMLKVTGDFWNDEDRAAYSRRLCALLNSKAPGAVLPKEPSLSALLAMAHTYRHDFGIPLSENGNAGSLTSGTTSEERQAILTLMRQLYNVIREHVEV
jgi:hypothetical protein